MVKKNRFSTKKETTLIFRKNTEKGGSPLIDNKTKPDTLL
jgi:hypothetical protein